MKAKSNEGNIWISFYKGLHCHEALLITLLSAVFNPTKNVFQHKSLTASHFREQQLNHYKEDTKTPRKRPRDIFHKKINAPMLTKPFGIKCIVPKQRVTTPTKNEVLEFTQKISKYSELISDTKKTSAEITTLQCLNIAFPSRSLQREVNIRRI